MQCFFAVYRIFENIVSDRAKNNVLVVGVGKSDVVEVLYKKGFRQIVAVDVSLTLINQLRSQYKDYVGVECKHPIVLIAARTSEF